VLEVARAALASGRANDAIATIERHVQKWPRGYLAEEREVLWIQALVLSGRRDEAFAKATLFRKTYPTSILQPAIEAALSPTQ
jgi:outer membrane protein assembly factor BamD (BamD/ComL family)